MFKPTHVVNNLESYSSFAEGECVQYVCTPSEHRWFSVQWTPHPITGFPHSHGVYINEDGLEQNISSYCVDEIKEEVA